MIKSIIKQRRREANKQNPGKQQANQEKKQQLSHNEGSKQVLVGLPHTILTSSLQAKQPPVLHMRPGLLDPGE